MDAWMPACPACMGAWLDGQPSTATCMSFDSIPMPPFCQMPSPFAKKLPNRPKRRVLCQLRGRQTLGQDSGICALPHSRQPNI